MKFLIILLMFISILFSEDLKLIDYAGNNDTLQVTIVDKDGNSCIYLCKLVLLDNTTEEYKIISSWNKVSINMKNIININTKVKE